MRAARPVPSPASLTFLILTLAAAGMACLISLLPAAGHDQMWHLYAARLLLHGTPLYGPGIFESNPPFIIWLSTVPVLTAHSLHLAETAAGKLYVSVLGCVVAWICLRLLERIRGGVSLARRLAFAFSWIAIFAVMPARDFGQRDHLLALLCLPYLVAAALRAEGIALPRAASIPIGVLALAGFALKPHQLLVPIAVESTLIWLRIRNAVPRPARSLIRPETLAMFVSGIAIVAAILILTPNYLTQIVPLVRDTYWAFGQWPLSHLLAEASELHILAAVTLILFFASGWRKASPLATLLIAAGLGSTLAYYLQGTGWYYQQIPALSFFAVALVLLLTELATRRNLTAPLWMPKAAASLSVLALALTTHFSGCPFTPERSFPIETPDPSFFANLRPGTAVMTLSTSVDAITPPLFKYNLTLGQRFAQLTLLPAILRSEAPEGGQLKRHLPPARIAELDSYQHAAIVADIARWHPALILIERCQDPAVHCQVLEDRHDDYLAWFLRDPAFRAAFAPYRYLRSSGPFDAYVPN